MLLLFDIAAEDAAEHDHWHTHEHMPERLGIPGFLRGTRWAAHDVVAHYCVLYEVAALAVLESAAYRERLDHPTPWTATVMRKYRGMRRALCTIEASSGSGMGSAALVVRFAPAEGQSGELDRWLADEVLPGVLRNYSVRPLQAPANIRDATTQQRSGAHHKALADPMTG